MRKLQMNWVLGALAVGFASCGDQAYAACEHPISQSAYFNSNGSASYTYLIREGLCFFASNAEAMACTNARGFSDVFNPNSGHINSVSSGTNGYGCYPFTTDSGSYGNGSNSSSSQSHASGSSSDNFVSSITWATANKATLVNQTLHVYAHVNAGGTLSKLTYVEIAVFTPDGQRKNYNFTATSSREFDFYVTSAVPGTAVVKSYASTNPSTVESVGYSTLDLTFSPIPQHITYTGFTQPSASTLTFTGACLNVGTVVLQVDGTDNFKSYETHGSCQPWTMSNVPLLTNGTHTLVFHSANHKATAAPVTLTCVAGKCGPPS